MVYKGDCLDFMEQMVERGERVNAIITDPPYLYLNHRLDRPFDEARFFTLASKITNKILFFGRGDSFYKWNLLCKEVGFEFKEEIVWDKRYPTSPTLPLARKHETIAVRMKKGEKINKVRVHQTLKQISNDLPRFWGDIKTLLNGFKDIEELKAYVKRGERVFKRIAAKRGGVTVRTQMNDGSKTIDTFIRMTEGHVLSSILSEPRDHYNQEHPTQKPINLLRKLVLLMTNKGDTILDPFAGSGSTGVACLIEGRKFLGCEIDDEYHALATRRLNETDKTLRQSLFYGIDD